MDILTIKNLKKKYKDINAVNGISLHIPKGASYGILGPNGAGKSTAINCILGLIPYDSGEVRFDEKKTLKEWNRYIGYIPQELAVYPDLTPLENVRFFASLYGIRGETLKQNVEEALDFVGLMNVKDKKAGEFSGGMKRRLNLACAIAHSPKLIIMDEPTVGIDPQSRNRILENVHELNSRGTTIIYTTHYMPEVEELCSRIAVLDHGQVIAEGSKQDIMKTAGRDEILNFVLKGNKEDQQLFLEKSRQLDGVHRVKSENEEVTFYYQKNDLLIQSIITLIQKHHLSIESIHSEEAKLEDVFLKLTGKTLRDTE